MPERVKVFFDESRAFRLPADRLPELAHCRLVRRPDAAARAAGPGASSISIRPRPSIDARLGAGHLLLFGPEIAWRAQPHGTFKFLFNGIYYSEKTD